MHTAGKGCSESKKSAANAGISWSLVRVVKALTHLSRSFYSMSSSDTREESFKPEYAQNLVIRCLRGWTRRCRKNDISCVPDNAPPIPLFRVWMQASRGLMTSISASVGGESHEANFFSSLLASKGAMPYWSEEEFF
jgi:hypothetical protein